MQFLFFYIIFGSSDLESQIIQENPTVKLVGIHERELRPTQSMLVESELTNIDTVQSQPITSGISLNNDDIEAAVEELSFIEPTTVTDVQQLTSTDCA